jgi:hypothetical protein
MQEMTAEIFRFSLEQEPLLLENVKRRPVRAG